jgi:PIN domain nuclease of toxin-antitoxin system
VKLLLDSHVFLWWCADDPGLRELEREAIRNAANDVFLSAASVWEMEIKRGLGRLRIPEPASAAVSRLGITALPVTLEHAEATGRLPALHRDPFDRLLVAQAKVEGLTLVTRDPLVRAYPGVAFLPA